MSYQWDIQDDVKILRDFLEGWGYHVWMDINKIHGGNNLSDDLAKAILNADLFICCITEKYVLSEMCKNEINLASRNKIKLITFKLPNST